MNMILHYGCMEIGAYITFALVLLTKKRRAAQDVINRSTDTPTMSPNVIDIDSLKPHNASYEGIDVHGLHDP